MISWIISYPRILLSIAIGGNLLGCIEVKEDKREVLGFQILWMIGFSSDKDGAGPHRAHSVTPLTNSQVTRRKGT